MSDQDELPPMGKTTTSRQPPPLTPAERAERRTANVLDRLDALARLRELLPLIPLHHRSDFAAMVEADGKGYKAGDLVYFVGRAERLIAYVPPTEEQLAQDLRDLLGPAGGSP